MTRCLDHLELLELLSLLGALLRQRLRVRDLLRDDARALAVVLLHVTAQLETVCKP
jgi:hypothetical protein